MTTKQPKGRFRYSEEARRILQWAEEEGLVWDDDKLVALCVEFQRDKPEMPIILCTPNDDDVCVIKQPGWVDDGGDHVVKIIACRDTAQLERVMRRLPVTQEQ